MADNVSITAGAGTTIAADDIAGVLYQRVKIAQGVDGAGTDVSAASPLNVIATLLSGTILQVGDNSGSLTVDGSVSVGSYLPSGSQPIGKFIPFDGTNNLGDVAARPMYVQATLGTLSVVPGDVNVLGIGGSFSAYQAGTYTVQPGNTPNTIGWLMTLATLPVSASLSSVVTLMSGTQVIGAGKYLPTLASLADQNYNPLALDLFGNLRVNPNTALPNQTRLNRFLTFASMASLMAAPGTGKRLVIREIDFSADATLSMKLVEDHAGTPATVWGPHYFPQNGGVTKTNCYIPITSNKSLGIHIVGATFNSTADLRVDTENV